MNQNDAIIRAVIVDDEPLGLDRLRQALSLESDLGIVAECAGGEEAIRAIEELRPDVVLLDVQMPEITGFDVIEAIGSADMPFVIFVTAYDDFAIAAFEANAVDYVVKPFTNDRIRTSIARIRRRLYANESPRLTDTLIPGGTRSRLIVRSGSRIEIINASEVDWFESSGNYILAHIGRNTRILRGTLGALEERLDPAQFMRIHRSTIVNSERVRSIKPLNKTQFTVTLQDGSSFPTSRTYRTRLREFLKSFHG